MIPLPLRLAALYPTHPTAVPTRPWWRFVPESPHGGVGEYADSFCIHGRFIRRDGRRGTPCLVEHDNAPYGERQVDLESWLMHLTKGISESSLDTDQILADANEDLRRPLTQMDEIDARFPLPHPGFRTGQIWASVGDPQERIDTVTILSEAHIFGVPRFGLLLYPLNSSNLDLYTEGELHGLLAGTWLLADPICPHRAPWAPSAGP